MASLFLENHNLQHTWGETGDSPLSFFAVTYHGSLHMASHNLSTFFTAPQMALVLRFLSFHTGVSNFLQLICLCHIFLHFLLCLHYLFESLLLFHAFLLVYNDFVAAFYYSPLHIQWIRLFPLSTSRGAYHPCIRLRVFDFLRLHSTP